MHAERNDVSLQTGPQPSERVSGWYET